MAADSVHLGGEFRPTNATPLPDYIDVAGLKPQPCPREELLRHHPKNSATSPFLGLDPSFPADLAKAERTITHIQNFDADDRVFVVFAHDTSIFNIVDFFPRTANDWKKRGWKEKGRWTYLPHLQKVAHDQQD